MGWRHGEENIREADWGNSVLKVSKQSVNARIKLLQRKWLMRTYINPEKLNLWSPDIPDTCWKCSEENRRSVSFCGDCKKTKQYWNVAVQLQLISLVCRCIIKQKCVF